MTLVFHVERCPDNPKLRAFIDWWQANGPFPITIAYGNRTDEEQAALYELGRSQPGKVVTNAKTAAESAHGHTGAIDCYPVRELYPNGMPKLAFLGDEADPNVRAQAQRRLSEYARHAEEHGLVSGANFPGLHDAPHVEDPDWKQRPVGPGVKA